MLPNLGMQILQYLRQEPTLASVINRVPTQVLASLSNKKLTLKDMEDICRICLSSSALLDIFPKKAIAFETGPSLAQKIMECVQYDIQENDSLPQKICIKCILNAESAFQFKRTCEQTQLVLRLKNMKEESYILDKKINLESTKSTSHVEPEKLQEKKSEIEINQITRQKPSVTMENKENQMEICNSKKAAAKPETTQPPQRYRLRERKVKIICSAKPTKKTISKVPANRIIQATLLRPRLRGQNSVDFRFKCPHCPAKFDRKNNLNCHIEFHTNPKLKEVENLLKKQIRQQRMLRKKKPQK